MTPTELEQARIIAESAIEIVQDCRKALGLEKGELLTVAVTRLADDRERLLARVAEDDRIRSRMFSLLLAIKHDAEWHDHQSRTPRVQFSAYHAEAESLLSELVSPSIAEEASKMIAHMALASSKPTEDTNASR